MQNRFNVQPSAILIDKTEEYKNSVNPNIIIIVNIGEKKAKPRWIDILPHTCDINNLRWT